MAAWGLLKTKPTILTKFCVLTTGSTIQLGHLPRKIETIQKASISPAALCYST